MNINARVYWSPNDTYVRSKDIEFSITDEPFDLGNIERIQEVIRSIAVDETYYIVHWAKEGQEQDLSNYGIFVFRPGDIWYAVKRDGKRYTVVRKGTDVRFYKEMRLIDPKFERLHCHRRIKQDDP